MQVLKKGFPDHTIIIDAYAQLFKHGIDICLHLLLASLMHHYYHMPALIHISADVLQLSVSERHSGSTQK